MTESTNVAPDFSGMNNFCQTDYQHAPAFLNSYNGSQATFNAYRREVERHLHWSWKFAQKSVCNLRRKDIEAYLCFCQKPPETGISLNPHIS